MFPLVITSSFSGGNVLVTMVTSPLLDAYSVYQVPKVILTSKRPLFAEILN